MDEVKYKYRCGLDWSERQRQGRMIRLCALVAVADAERMAMVFREVRETLGYPQAFEFHGQNDAEETQFALLAAVWEAKTGVRVAATIRDEPLKTAAKSGSDVMATLGIATLERLIPTVCMAEVTADEDIKGQDRQKRFVTNAKRAHSARWPSHKCKVRFYESDKSDLIQLADLVVYGLGRLHLGLVKHEKLRALLEKIVEDAGDLIVEERVE